MRFIKKLTFGYILILQERRQMDIIATESRFVAYVRVSTVQQGESGLGLEAQRRAVDEYVATVGGRLGEVFVEIESGKRNDRPQLAAAVDACKREKAVLIIAKLDRLARNVAFISALMEAGVSFVAADNPHANKLMLHLLAAFAEHERDQVRARTKAALAVAKARGVVLGRYGREVLSQRNRDEAIERARALADVVMGIRRDGATIVRMAEIMNNRGIPTARGGRWHTSTVHTLLRRIENLPGQAG